MAKLSNKQIKKLKMNLQQHAEPIVPIFDMVTASDVGTYWETKAIEQPPYLGELLFPNNKQTGMSLEWFLGQTGSPRALQPSAFGAEVIPRNRKDFSKIMTTLAFFRESYQIDEELRQKLLLVMMTGNQSLIDNVLNLVFNDIKNLVDAAAVRREITRMDLLTTGKALIEGNGQTYSVDYEMPETHMGNAATSWSDVANSDPVADLETAMDTIETDTGERPSRAILNNVTMRQLRNSKTIGLNLYPNGGSNIRVGANDVTKYLQDELNLEVVVYSKTYTDVNNLGVETTKKFIPDNVITLLPAANLGTTWFGTTPEEADLMASNEADVVLVDTGVAVTTRKIVNPVTVETIVSMITMPTFEQRNKVFILNTIESV